MNSNQRASFTPTYMDPIAIFLSIPALLAEILLISTIFGRTSPAMHLANCRRLNLNTAA